MLFANITSGGKGLGLVLMFYLWQNLKYLFLHLKFYEKNLSVLSLRNLHLVCVSISLFPFFPPFFFCVGWLLNVVFRSYKWVSKFRQYIFLFFTEGNRLCEIFQVEEVSSVILRYTVHFWDMENRYKFVFSINSSKLSLWSLFFRVYKESYDSSVK